MENNYKIEWNKVYYKWKEIDWADSKTFKIINQDFSYDKNSVYYVCYHRICKEKYSRELNEYFEWTVIKEEESILKITCSARKDFLILNENYIKINGFIYFFLNQSSKIIKSTYEEDLIEIVTIKDLRRIDFANPETFKILDSNFSKDKNFVFLHSHKLDWIDAQSFHLLNDYYAKDKNNIYFISYYENLENVASEFEDYIHTYFSSLGNSREREDFFWEYDYISEEKINIEKINDLNIDIHSFEVIDWVYAKDKNIIIFEGGKVFSIYEWFEVLNPYFAKDKRNIFIRNFDYTWHVDIIEDWECIVEDFFNKLTWADIESFEILNINFAKDKKHIYDSSGEIIE